MHTVSLGLSNLRDLTKWKALYTIYLQTAPPRKFIAFIESVAGVEATVKEAGLSDVRYIQISFPTAIDKLAFILKWDIRE